MCFTLGKKKGGECSWLTWGWGEEGLVSLGEKGGISWVTLKGGAGGGGKDCLDDLRGERRERSDSAGWFGWGEKDCLCDLGVGVGSLAG